MSAHFFCPICGEPFQHGPHLSKNVVLGKPVKNCPLKEKAAIYVYVQDDRGAGLQGSTVNCDGKNPDSDPEGYAIFDQLEDSKTYPTTIGPKLTDGFYLFSPSKFDPTAHSGSITMVVFQLNPYAELKVAVKRSDKENVYFKDVVLTVTTDTPTAAPQTPQQHSSDTGPVSFSKLKRTDYKITATLAGNQKEEFELEDPAETTKSVEPHTDNLVEFLVSPAGWINFHLVEKKGASESPLDGAFNLQQSGKSQRKENTDAGAAKLKRLEAGNFKIDNVEIGEQYEFVELVQS